MKYVPSAFVGRLSRSAGATTASHNKYGAYFRNRVMPTNPQSSFQTAVRGNFADLSTGWRLLTAAQREGWITLGQSMERTDSLGQTFTLTGIQAYISVNNNKLTASGTTTDNAPTYQLPDQPVLGTIAFAAGAGTMTVDAGTPPAGDFIAIYATRPMSDGRNFAAKSEFKLLQVIDDSQIGAANVAAAYTTRFGSITGKAGEKIFIRLVALTDFGFASTPIQGSSIIAA